ncbi:SAM-dependent methyltransferase [Solidesulfovibrio alcoholivorans]|uniref:SAM-dependent methyltransferase n=1 Tax=Solidesulfovibrio alcoholivorans TaxID=81406 RepID=UPI000495A9DA|nr:SAM-dependent methyltransferase [Solidesulfovibrio alcoholivorans]
MPFTVYHAAPGLVAELTAELGDAVTAVRDPLVVADGPPRQAAFAANVWTAPEFIQATSIGQAAKALTAIQRNWSLVPTGHFRRAALVAEKLPRVSAKPLPFGQPLPTSPLGAFTLWDENLLLASPTTSEPVPDGSYRFAEDKEGPPSRAYLKLWELFTRLGQAPRPGELCLDMGGSPGGWAFVLAGLGARVFCIDKAPLAPNVAGHPLVSWCQGSAFGLDPRHVGAADWLFSDVICYPDRLYEWLSRWLALGECRNYVLTVKLQGETDFRLLGKFRDIPGSRLLHLSHNKHELTFVRLAAQAPPATTTP